MIKLITSTWSYSNTNDISNTFLYKSFIKNNPPDNFVNIHFNRNLYASLEEEFSNKFGFQHEFILYKIFLLKKEIEKTQSEYLIFSDANDVVCLSNIDGLVDRAVQDKVIFSSESNQYPSEENTINWPNNKYENSVYLNSGLYIGTKENVLKMMNQAIEHTMQIEFKNFGGDQGVYVYDYLNNKHSIIDLDKQSKTFLSTYLRAWNSYVLENNKLMNVTDGTSPVFIHDNGWNFGSPKFIEKFNLG